MKVNQYEHSNDCKTGLLERIQTPAYTLTPKGINISSAYEMKHPKWPNGVTNIDYVTCELSDKWARFRPAI